jgi:hypothetical protein
MNYVNQARANAGGQYRLDDLNRGSVGRPREQRLQVLARRLVTVGGAIFDFSEDGKQRVAVSDDLLSLSRRVCDPDAVFPQLWGDSVKIVSMQNREDIPACDIRGELVDALVDVVDMS